VGKVCARLNANRTFWDGLDGQLEIELAHRGPHTPDLRGTALDDDVMDTIYTLLVNAGVAQVEALDVRSPSWTSISAW
jgi:hypothetical protein